MLKACGSGIRHRLSFVVWNSNYTGGQLLPEEYGCVGGNNYVFNNLLQRRFWLCNRPPFSLQHMNARVPKNPSSDSKLFAAGIFTLALLMLVVTCPLKRMVQVNLSANTTAQKFHHATVHYSAATEHTAVASCCALKKKEHMLQGSVVKIRVPSPNSIVPYLTVVQGFGIHYFLSRAGREHSSILPAASLSLPLFLQHLRLRI